MTGTIALKVEGIADLQEKFALLKAGTQKAVLRRALREAGEVVRAEAERLAPYDNASEGPHLKDNIIARVRITGEVQEATVGFDKKVYHGQFQELGTKDHPAQPFLRPALDAKQGEAIERVADVLMEQVDKAVRRKRSRKDG